MLPQKLLTPKHPDDPINVVIETPANCRNKYKYDEDSGIFLLHKILPAGAVFPFDFGFIPGTKADDGDPLDVLLLLDAPVFCGCIVPTRLIGVLEAKQTENGKTTRNDRLIGVSSVSQDYGDIRTIKDVNQHLCDEIEHFFVSYNEEQGRKFKPLGFKGLKTARKLIENDLKKARKDH